MYYSVTLAKENFGLINQIIQCRSNDSDIFDVIQSIRNLALEIDCILLFY